MLLTPGPVAVPEFIMQAISKPVIHHRSDSFKAFYKKLLTDLQYLFQTQQYTCTVIGSGTYGVEVAMYSLFSKGESVLILDNGKFSNRWVRYAEVLQCEVASLRVEWGKVVSKKQLLEALTKYPNCKGIVMTHSETSTGALLDLEELVWEIKRQYPQMLILVDAITSVGSLPFYMDDWKIDCAVVASQKALMNPAGVCAIALSEYGREMLSSTNSSDFKNLYNYLSAADSYDYPFTPPLQLLYGIQASLDYIKQIGLPTRWNAIHQKATYFRREIEKIGGVIFSTNPTDSLTAFYVPTESGAHIKEQLEKSGITISGGQGNYKGKLLRVSHMGMERLSDLAHLVDTLKDIIKA